MNTTNNTVLITGGSAGIGFEMARQFSEKGNKVIITGRNEDRLKTAAAQLSNVTAIRADVTNEADTLQLVAQLQKDFPALNIVINNAGSAYYYDLAASTNSFKNAQEEILTNYLSIIRLNELLLPALQEQATAAIVNVSSIVAFVPGARLPTYSASKAALHSYTQSLRVALRSSTVSVFELMPPLVNTNFSKDIGGENGIAPAQVAQDLVQALATDQTEIHVGMTADLYNAFLASPADALLMVNPVS
ncbi:SDR family oxidoreductase [Flavobacterium kingsejongi]|uniref:Short-chain dehydrogenase n=1 Tax=Flavobacterium kingsejongi TaxID=1678728 RepID=A0A2S1LQM0_9FLAO|nr:SDR family NAD(P)-dependent oxidoreductase [Flavobacterium kingsejongi]AWG25962.1 short-chain dehydrogenase [Flavobacterium kingsejongi]